jgi:hypothetical protein
VQGFLEMLMSRDVEQIRAFLKAGSQ